MCVTNIYVDLYPDGRRQEFRQTSICQYGLPGRPCAKTSTLENPVRKIQWGEPTTEYMLTSHARTFAPNHNQTNPSTPPRSSGGSMNRKSGGYSSGEEGLRGRRRDSRTNSKEKEKDKRPSPIRRATREHRKERIVIVDSPPTPRTPPQLFNQVFTAPNSPIPRTGRPIIVDERPRPRVPSIGAVVGDRIPIIRRSRSSSRPRRASRSSAWDSPSSSHTSFDLQSRAEEERIAASERRRQERDDRIKELEAQQRRESIIKAHDEEIRRRPAVPLAPPPRLRNRPFLQPIVDQTRQERIVPVIVVSEEARRSEEEARRRREERERAQRLRWEAEEQEALKQRLRERQMPMRRFSVGPAMRRHRVLYDDGVYRYE